LTEAQYYFEKKEFITSAKKYARTKKSFEDIVLTFLDVQNNEPLTFFLLEKLDSLDSSMTSQKTILCTWIVEIFLNRINALEDAPDDGSRSGPFCVAPSKWLPAITGSHPAFSVCWSLLEQANEDPAS